MADSGDSQAYAVILLQIVGNAGRPVPCLFPQLLDYSHFFGREALVKKMIDHLGAKNINGSTNRFLAVVGPSGSGKSSVVKAGLIPALWHGDLPGSEKWFVIDVIPGTHPLEELEIGLMRIAAHQSGSLMDQLQRDMRGLVRVAKLILPDDESELLVVIDQFEELLRLSEKAAFLYITNKKQELYRSCDLAEIVSHA